MVRIKTHRSNQVCFKGVDLAVVREQAGLSQTQLAAKLTILGAVGIYQRKISRLETMHEFPVVLPVSFFVLKRPF
jgi:hypothetical protein